MTGAAGSAAAGAAALSVLGEQAKDSAEIVATPAKAARRRATAERRVGRPISAETQFARLVARIVD
jgi:hypothetical protein